MQFRRNFGVILDPVLCPMCKSVTLESNPNPKPNPKPNPYADPLIASNVQTRGARISYILCREAGRGFELGFESGLVLTLFLIGGRGGIESYLSQTLTLIGYRMSMKA